MVKNFSVLNNRGLMQMVEVHILSSGSFTESLFRLCAQFVNSFHRR